MEGIMIGIILGLMFLYFQSGKASGVSSDYKSSIHKLDDKNYIVNNKFVSLEEDTPLLRLQQQMEDDKIWFAYEQEKLRYHRERLHNIWKYTIEVWQKRTDQHNLPQYGVSNRRLVLIADDYEKYIKDCERFDETLKLPIELYALYKFDRFVWFNIPLDFIFPTYGTCGIYYINNEKTARYKGNSNTVLAKEFYDKYYKA